MRQHSFSLSMYYSILGPPYLEVVVLYVYHHSIPSTHVFASSYLVINVALQVQSNVFKGVTGEVALTAAGGLRQIPGVTETFESAALVKLLTSSFSALSKNLSVPFLLFIYLMKRKMVAKGDAKKRIGGITMYVDCNL